MRTEQSDVAEVARQALAVTCETTDRLHLALGEMGVDADVELFRETFASEQELVRAVCRNRRTHGEAHAASGRVAILQQSVPHDRQDLRAGSGATSLELLA